jgi:[protein-PII] uridylyltransferase
MSATPAQALAGLALTPSNPLDRVRLLRQRLSEGQARIRQAYEEHPRTSSVLQGRSHLVDGILRQLWAWLDFPHDCTLAAVGGYGRGELYPGSDVDLLVLITESPSETLRARLSELVSELWDIGLEIGHSVRTIEECLLAAQGDITVETTLLEARYLTGNSTLFEILRRAFTSQLNVRQFYKAKRFEQAQRYTRYNDTPYALEPNCKESPGGLRDLQMLGWISRATGLGSNWRELARRRLITASEATELRSIERFLQHVRIRLHYLAGRGEDRLLFDYQERLADGFGIKPTQSKRASEVFMQRYYINAKKATQLNTILLQNYGSEIFPERNGPAIFINERFQTVRDLLDMRAETVFEETPSALLECFLLLQQRSELRGMTARTLRALWLNRHRINAEFRAAPANRALFLEILQQRRGIVHEFRRMNQYGILSRYLPPWHRVVCQMQHDLFHAYTVDQHSLMVLRNLRRFTMGEHVHEYPLLTRLMLAFEDHWLLYIAALFHDIAKGRGGDHSLLGKEDAWEFCITHGLREEETALVVWLVEHHLSMSMVAQKQDTSDPEVVRRFADKIQTERRLTALYLLTHADIRGTSPKVWNGWKGKLLEDLFFAVRKLLRGATPEQALGLDDRQEHSRGLLRYHGLRSGVEEALWSQLDAVYFMRHLPEEIAWHTRILYYRPQSPDPVVKARVLEDDQGVQVMIYTPDQKDLFVRITGFLGRLGFSILDAKIHTTRHGYALDSFFVQNTHPMGEYKDLIALIEHELGQHLRSPDAPMQGPAAGRLSREVRHFPIFPNVRIRPDDAGKHFILSLTAADRPGLLFQVAQVLAEHGINIHTAKIATLGERVEDTFLLSGSALHQDAQIVRIEQRLIQKLQI